MASAATPDTTSPKTRRQTRKSARRSPGPVHPVRTEGNTHELDHVSSCVLFVAAIATFALTATASSAEASSPRDNTASVSAQAKVKRKVFKNCTHLNRRWPHGLARRHAHDKTSSGDPVRNFKRSNRLFKRAMKINKGLDADGDHVACEKHRPAGPGS